MTQVTPAMLSARASSLSLRQQALSSSAMLNNNNAPAPRSVEDKQSSKSFILSDMKGRDTRDNRVCASCIAKLAPEEVGQVNWHLEAGQACRLCQVEKLEPEAFTKPFCDFLQENPTIFHTVEYFEKKLKELGYEHLSPRDSWADKIQPGGKYWVTRNGSSLIAFKVGKAYQPGNGVAMIGGHIDALTAKLKPVSTKPVKAGFVQLGVAPYAGALNATWWDRDLSIGGRVVVRDEESGKTCTKLVKLDWPIARIPTLAPHFGVGMMGENNKETQAVPIIGLESSQGAAAKVLGPAGSFVNTQPPRLVELIAKELKIQSYSSIINWELELYDSQPAQTGGMDREFIFAGRIDDKLCSWSALTALLASNDSSEDGGIKLVALFDDEEIGSLLRQGARGNFLPSVVERAVEALNPDKYGPELKGRTYSSSFFCSSDVTHSGNPNFLEKYLSEHVPELNVGVVIANDSNGHMTTDSISTAIMQRAGELGGCRTQTFQIRNDSRSGGTIGPALSSMMGVRAADVGLPQLSMHSVRATTGSLDPGLGVKFFKSFLDNWEKIDAEWH
ncbi:aminopeptidase I zinc metalloprotease-domain-containing protein [Fusarium flagelliforme]|uniref:aminopeptidase I zinc metalloprotease-domain-containing protein n=1 Tax=Fusarium flagelliforme TaxID=2675880 RepID=UPI001E8EF3EC|nr:aminopeptidase I zinc metalloprotease-domain-containing protein [Fusarium flagelliforme]KAH7192182.1 aminopeptidase I zinc metalloprotease-domain-containing protein [Fusarium flagelliforme]